MGLTVRVNRTWIVSATAGICIALALHAPAQDESPPPPTDTETPARTDTPARADASALSTQPSALSDFSMQSGSFMAIWREALQALLGRDKDATEAAFGRLLELDVSAFRVALLADESIRRGGFGGGVLVLEQDAKLNRLGENGQKIAELLATGREQVNQADDGFYFAALGRFDVANANLRALLETKPDPVAVLEFVDQRPNRKRVLLQIVNNPVVGETARELARMLETGEVGVKADPRRIRANIARLAGPPRGFENALAALRESSEFAVPFLIDELQRPESRNLVRPILRALPQLDRRAVNPLTAALEMPDGPVKNYLIEALGEMGYRQAAPYLLKLRDAESTSPQTRAAVERALGQITARGEASSGNAADEFFNLAESYYQNSTSLAADPRVPQAQVWVWNNGVVQNIPVPSPIFEEVMAMRASEEALLLNPEHEGALALWIAANFRRAAQLPEGETDATRPENDPPPVYYAQSAGPRYALSSLRRGVKAGEAPVALGSIEALQQTAGPAALMSGSGLGVAPLAEALTFPQQLVRVRAALAIAGAGLTQEFPGYQNVVPALAEALQFGALQRGGLVIEGDDASANSVAASLRTASFQVISDANLLAGLEKARRELPNIDVVVLAADLQNPPLADAIAEVRKDYRFSGVPILIISKPGTESTIRRLQDRDDKIGLMPQVDDPDVVQAQIARIGRATGVAPMAEDQAADLALQAAGSLAHLARTNAKLYDPKQAEAALIATTRGGSSPELRIAAGQGLAFVPTKDAQDTLATLAMSADADEALRVAMFNALAQAGRAVGNKLSPELVDKLIEQVAGESNLTIREAASRSLGALNVSGNPASTIIREQHRF